MELTGGSFLLSGGLPRRGGERTEHPEVRRRAAEVCLGTLQPDAVWIWSDGSEEDGVIRAPSSHSPLESHGRSEYQPGKLCSSTRVELFALRAALTDMDELTQETPDIATDTTTPPTPQPPNSRLHRFAGPRWPCCRLVPPHHSRPQSERTSGNCWVRCRAGATRFISSGSRLTAG